MLSTLRNAWKVPELRKKILWTILLVAIFRMGRHIPVPGIDSELFKKPMTQSGGLLGFYDMISGGAFSKFSILALGVMPYINASIIMQLLTIAIPSLEQLSKEGEEGRKKIQNATRYVSIGIAFILAYGIFATISSRCNSRITINSKSNSCIFISSWYQHSVCGLVIKLQLKGFGNGTSILIFVNIYFKSSITINSIIYT